MSGNPIEEILQQIESLGLDAIMLDPGDIPGLGKTIKTLESIEDLLSQVRDESLLGLTRAMKGYIEKIILAEESDLSPFEKGISQLQEICNSLVNREEFDQDLSSLLLSLGYEEMGTPDTSSRSEEGQGMEPKGSSQNSKKIDLADENSQREEEKEIGEFIEDKEIIADFVTESLENLGTIEVKLIDLEQDPSDLETINAIFRPFHTTKGVSGFLNFNKINRLAHTVENLLDRARNGELYIDGGIIDIILDSVDTLKSMIENVKASLDKGTPLEGDVDIDQLIARIERLNTQAERGGERPLGEMLVAKGSVSEEDIEDALDNKKEKDGKKIGEILIEKKKIETKEVVSAIREQKRFGQRAALQVKIDTVKLDHMVDMVGELAIAQSMLRQNEQIRTSRNRELGHIINHLNKITTGLQRTAISLRMVPIKNTFQKMLRLVRDLAKKADKEVQLVMSGEGTEIDRNMVEEIYEPMVHMIRNSIDHGLEMAAERETANKPRHGTIHLRAYHRRGEIVIEIEDDGRGFDREKILQKSISSGLVKEEETLTDTEIDNLIFHPGLSTAEKVSDISGRGVGMDVVKSHIERLRGKVQVRSVEGRGTTFLIRLPLTLAMVNGMIVKVGGERYIIPTLSVQESFRPNRVECHTVMGEGEMILVRDDLFPLTRLDQVLGLGGNDSSNGWEKAAWDRLVVVVENQEKKRGLLVDELLGQEEVVVKSLGAGLRDVKGVAGGAIMGDGRVGLILDIAGLFDLASEEP